jgi:hypothetical protein
MLGRCGGGTSMLLFWWLPVHGCRMRAIHFSLPNDQAPLQIAPWFTDAGHLPFWTSDAAAAWTCVRMCTWMLVLHTQHVTSMHQPAGALGNNAVK